MTLKHSIHTPPEFHSILRFFFKLEYSWFTMSCFLQVYSQVVQLCIHTYLFQILFPYRSLQNTEYSSLWYTVGPCCSSILYIIVCMCWFQTPNLSLPHSFLVTISLFSVSWLCFCFVYKFICISFFCITHVSDIICYLSLSGLLHLDNLKVHLCCCKWHFILFYGWVVFHCVNIPHLYLFICWWTFTLLVYLGYCT